MRLCKHADSVQVRLTPTLSQCMSPGCKMGIYTDPIQPEHPDFAWWMDSEKKRPKLKKKKQPFRDFLNGEPGQPLVVGNDEDYHLPRIEDIQQPGMAYRAVIPAGAPLTAEAWRDAWTWTGTTTAGTANG